MTGRAARAADMVEQLPGDDEGKRRLCVILSQVSGEISVAQACAAIGVRPSRYYELRESALESARQGLELKPAGRRRRLAAEPPELVRLRRERDELARENDRLRLTQEVLQALPNAMTWARTRDSESQKRGAGPARSRARPGKGVSR